jgi:hypothetical protein
MTMALVAKIYLRNSDAKNMQICRFARSSPRRCHNPQYYKSTNRCRVSAVCGLETAAPSVRVHKFGGGGRRGGAI